MTTWAGPALSKPMRKPVMRPFQPGMRIHRNHGARLRRRCIARRCRPWAANCGRCRYGGEKYARRSLAELRLLFRRPLDVAVGLLQSLGPPVRAQPRSRCASTDKGRASGPLALGSVSSTFQPLVVDCHRLGAVSASSHRAWSGRSIVAGERRSRESASRRRRLASRRKWPALRVSGTIVLLRDGRSLRR